MASAAKKTKPQAAEVTTHVNDPSTDAPGLPLEKVDGLRIEAKALAAAMKNAAAIVQSAAIIPILANARLLADGSVLQIVTSDMDTEYRQDLPLKFECALAVTVDAKRLAALANSVAPDAVISMTAKDGRLAVSAGRSRWQLPTISPDDYPIMPFSDPAATTEIGGKALADAIGRIAWVDSNEKTQAYLAGALFHSVDNRLYLASANGKSMGLSATAAKLIGGTLAAMVPDKYLGTLAGLAAVHDEPVSLAWDDRKIRAQIGDVVLTGKLLENSFPDYTRVIPAPDANPVTFTPDNILAALKRVAIVADERTRCITVKRCEGAITLSASSGDGGEAGEDVLSDAEAGHATGINGQIFAAMIAAIGGDTIEMHQADGDKAMMFRRAVDDGTLAIIMPMRIREA
jgi:DNA polymerase-3 subunit beta